MSCRFLSRHLHFSHSMLWGETFLVSALSNHLHAGNWAAPEGGLFLGSVDEKDTRYKRGHKNFRIKKPAVCELLTAGLCFHPKNDFFSQARGEKPRFHAGFRHALLLVFSHFPKKMRKSGRAILGRGAGRFKAAAPSRTPPPHCAPHRFPWNPPGAAG